MADVVAFVDDIFFQAKIAEAAKQTGVELRTCGAPETLEAELASATPKLVLVDLNARANAFDAISRARAAASEAPLIAFFSHVQADLAERARAAGYAEVMPRSKFTRVLATILARAKSQA